jgi:lipopolysaccharide export system permease protein
MTRADRYISGLFWTFFVSGLLVFAVMYVAMDSISLFTSFDSLHGSSLLRYYQWFFPEIIYRMIPVAAMVATVFVLTSLNRAHELVAFFSLGVSLLRLSAPILFWVSGLCALQLFLSDSVLPNFTREKNFIYYNEIEKKPHLYSTVKTDKIWYRSQNNIFYIQTLDESTHTARGFTLYSFSPSWDLMQMITAKKAEIKGSTWTLRDGSLTLLSTESSFPLTSNFKEKTIVMGENSEDLSQTTAHTSDTLNLKQLAEFIRKNKEAGLDTVRYEVDYHSKFGYSLAALVMALLALPFSVGKARSGSVMKGVGISIGLVFFYWMLYNSALTLGKFGQIPPVVAAWGPNFLMSGAAFFLIRMIRR